MTVDFELRQRAIDLLNDAQKLPTRTQRMDFLSDLWMDVQNLYLKEKPRDAN